MIHPTYEFWIDSFFAAADEFRAEGGKDPAAVSLPTWTLHALARSPEMGAALGWPSRKLPFPETVLGLPVIALGEGFVFYDRADPKVQRWAETLPEHWPWTASPAIAMGGLSEDDEGY